MCVCIIEFVVVLANRHVPLTTDSALQDNI
jgi:hypothetical protein